MFDDGVENQFEHAHQTGLKRGFDLGLSYKGQFDRSLLRDMISKLDPKRDSVQIKHLNDAIEFLRQHKNNREFITNR